MIKVRIFAQIILFIVLITSTLLTSAQTLLNLKTEYAANPIGIDQNPRFSWQIKSTTKNMRQTAYQILVASTAELLKKDQGDLWNTNKVNSDNQIFIEYKGKPLASRQRAFWKVKIWNEKAKASVWSEGAFFEMGLLKKDDWTAQWIGMLGTEGKGAAPKAVELQKEFKLNKRPVKARIYVTGLGAYVVNFNGKKVGADYLTPGWTDYLKTLHYQTYEIDAEDLSVGANFLSATLGSGWWSSGLGWGGNAKRYSEGPNRLLFQMEFTFYDGSIQTIVSDKTWQVRPSAITSNAIYQGETYDARLEYTKNWKEADILNDVENKTYLFGKDEAVNKNEEAAIFSTKNISLKASVQPQVQVIEEIKPIKVTEPKKGHFVFDFGQNLVGYCKIKVSGKAGKEVEIKFGELLDAKGMVDQANLRSIRPKDTYILKGYGEEEWEPKFTYHGFRYAQIDEFPGKPNINTIVAKVIHNNVANTGKFTCSNPLLNQIQKNILWSQRGNMTSVPTDCPQRDERLGWMGDAAIFAPTASYNMDMNAFFMKWMGDIADSQHSSGYVYNVNPKIEVPFPGAPAWGDAAVIIPYHLYKFYGDKRALEQYYPNMQRWVEYMNKHENTLKNGLYHMEQQFEGKPFYGFGDWVPVEASPTKPIGGSYQIYSNKMLSEIAGILGKNQDRDLYAKLALDYTKKYQELYFSIPTKNYEGATQGANLLPLTFGITPKDYEAAVAKNIADNVKAKNNHLTTGFLSTQMLLPTLSKYGEHELAYTVATKKTYPSWGYMVEKGATTMWELWNSDTEKPEGMNSRNHFAYGSVGEWYYGYLAGIQQDSKSAGFKKVVIAPMPAGDLTFAEASYQSGYGNIKSRWDKTDKGYKLAIEIPANSTATVQIPTKGNDKLIIKESNKILKPKTITKDKASFEIGSGTWLFEW